MACSRAFAIASAAVAYGLPGGNWIKASIGFAEQIPISRHEAARVLLRCQVDRKAAVVPDRDGQRRKFRRQLCIGVRPNRPQIRRLLDGTDLL
jgi:hypothetical protein